jgi:PAS domain S-box-containing protein
MQHRPPQRQQRRFAAILAADVVGFGQLLEKDESGVLARLKRLHRDVVEKRTDEQGGRIVRVGGGAFLAEFPSVFAAMSAALAIQRDATERERALPEDRQIAFRMGVNVGDVLVDGADIIGDGVNVAESLADLAEAEGIWVTARVHEDTAGRLDLDFEDLGEQALRNVARLVRIYRIDRPSKAAVAGSTAFADSAAADIRGEEGEALLRLLAPGGPMAVHPGPIVLALPGSKIAAANAIGRQLLQLLQNGHMPEFETMLAKAIDQASASSEPARHILKYGLGDRSRVVEFLSFSVDGGAECLLIGRDVTLDQNLKSALVESRQRFRDLVEISSDFAWEIGADSRFVFVSPKGALGYEADDLVGRHPQELALDDRGSERLPFVTKAPVEAVEVWCRKADGGAVCLVASASPLFDEDGAWRGVRGVCRDVTQEREHAAQLAGARNRQLLMARVVRAIRDEVEPGNMLGAAATAVARAMGAKGCLVLRRDGNEFRPAAHKGAGLAPDALARALSGIGDDAGLVQHALKPEEGGGSVLAMPTSYRGKANGAIVVWRGASDIAWTDDDCDVLTQVSGQLGIAFQQIAAHEELTRLSSTDALTGLLNRRTFFARIAQRMAEGAMAGTGGALVYADLDNFKQVNDRRGHQAGDDALRIVAKLLAEETRDCPSSGLVRQLAGVGIGGSGSSGFVG